MQQIYCPHCGKLAATVQPAPSVDALPNGASLDMRIADYPWPVPYRARIISTCVYEKIETFRDLGKFTRGEMLRCPNFGVGSLNQIHDALNKLGVPPGTMLKRHYE